MGGVRTSIQTRNRAESQASAENSLKVIELDPNFSASYNYLGQSYIKLGRNAEGIANLEKSVALSNRAGVELLDLGYGYAITGNRAGAIAIVNELLDKHRKKEALGRYVAGVHAGLGDKDKAFEWLEKDFKTKQELGNIR